MIDIAVIYEQPWQQDENWEALAVPTVKAALLATPFAALNDVDLMIEIAIKLSSDDEVQNLNRDYRGKDKPTNILSFPQTPPDLLQAIATSVNGPAAGDDGEAILGDMILAREVCVREAEEKGISLKEHVTHLIVHGTLHLLGYDHIEDEEATDMEALEIQILAGLGISDPYGDRD